MNGQDQRVQRQEQQEQQQMSVEDLMTIIGTKEVVIVRLQSQFQNLLEQAQKLKGKFESKQKELSEAYMEVKKLQARVKELEDIMKDGPNAGAPA